MLTEIEVKTSTELNDINCSSITIETRTVKPNYLERLRLRELNNIKIVNSLEQPTDLIL